MPSLRWSGRRPFVRGLSSLHRVVLGGLSAFLLAACVGVEQGAVPSRPLPEISDATHCIRCKTAYEYDYVSYGHLGGFRCPKCGYRRHKADVAVTSVVEQRLDGSSIVLEAEGEKKLVEVNLPAMYNIYNAVGAAAAVTAMGLPLQAAIDALGSFHCGFGRMEQTILTSSIFLPATSRALRRPAEEMMAVPCWSSCITGMSSDFLRRSSI